MLTRHVTGNHIHLFKEDTVGLIRTQLYTDGVGALWNTLMKGHWFERLCSRAPRNTSLLRIHLF